MLTYIVNVVLDPVKTNFDILYLSKTKECFNDVLFRITDVHSEYHIGSCSNLDQFGVKTHLVLFTFFQASKAGAGAGVTQTN